MSCTFDTNAPDSGEMNVANVNARVIILMLSLPDSGYLHGECPLTRARVAILLALNTNGYLAKFTRTSILEGNFREQGIDEAYLRERLEQLQVIVAAAQAKGATLLRWS